MPGAVLHIVEQRIELPLPFEIQSDNPDLNPYAQHDGNGHRSDTQIPEHVKHNLYRIGDLCNMNLLMLGIFYNVPWCTRDAAKASAPTPLHPLRNQ